MAACRLKCGNPPPARPHRKTTSISRTRKAVGRVDRGPAARVNNRTASRNGLPGSSKWKLRFTGNRTKGTREETLHDGSKSKSSHRFDGNDQPVGIQHAHEHVQDLDAVRDSQH